MVRKRASGQCAVATACLIAASVSAAAAASETSIASGPAPTVTGSAGLFRLSTTDVGDARHLRLALYGELSRAGDFLVFGDTNTKAAANLAAGLAVHPHVELFAAVRSAWNRNAQAATPASSASASTVWSGGFVVGAKAATPIVRGLAAGVEIGARLPFAAGSWPTSGAAWIDVIASLDVMSLAPVPLRVHGSAGYYADGSRNQRDLTGQPAAARQVALFAYGMGSSRIRTALALDSPLERWTGRIGLHPFVEYHFDLVTADPDPMLSDQSPYHRGQDWLTFGVRARAGARVTLIAGVDLNLLSIGFPYGPPLAPWNAFAGTSLPLAF